MGMAEIGLRIFLQDSSSGGLGAFQNNLQGMLNLATNGQGVFYGLSQSINDAGGAGTVASGGFLASKEALLATAGVAAGASLALLGYVGATVYAVQQNATLDDALASLQIAFNATDAQMGVVKTTLLEVANNSRFTVSEVADGWTMLAEKGQNLAAVVQGGVGQAMVNLAEATKSETVPAAELLSTTMTVFGAKASDASKYVDLLTFAFYHGIPSIQEMQTVIQDVGAKAAQMHIPFQDLSMVIDFLTQSGIQASVAANSLRFMLDALTAPTKKTQDALSDLGIITINQTNPALRELEQTLRASGKAGAAAATAYDGSLFSLNALFTAAQKLGTIKTDETFYQWADASGILNNKLFTANGQFVGLTQGIDAIGQAIAKLPNDRQKEDAINTLFAPRSAKDATLLLDNLGHLHAALDKLGLSYAQFQQNGGAMADAARMNETFNGTMSRLLTTMASFMANVGGPFADFLKTLANGLNGVVGTLQKTNPQVFALVSTFLLAGTGISAVTVVIGAIILAMTAFNGILLPLAGAAAGTLVTITALAGVGTLLASHWNTVVPILKQAGAALLAIGTAVAGIGGFLVLREGMSALLSVGPQLIGFLIDMAAKLVWTGASAAVSAVRLLAWAAVNMGTVIPLMQIEIAELWSSAVAWVAGTGGLILLVPLAIAAAAGIYLLIQRFGGINTIISQFGKFLGPIGAMFQDMGNQIKGQLVAAMHQLEPTWKQLMIAFQTARPVLMVIGGVIAIIAAIIVGVLIAALNGLLHMIVPFIGMLVGVFSGLVRVIMGLAQLFLGLITVIHGVFVGLTTGNWGMVLQGFTQMGQGIYNVFAGLWNAVKAVFVGAFGMIAGFVTGFISGIVGWFKGLADILVHHSIIPDMVNAILGVFMNLVNMGRSLFTMLVSAIISIVSTIVGVPVAKAHEMVDGIRNAISSAAGAAGSWVHNAIVTPITNTLNALVNLGMTFGSNFVHMLANGIANAAGAVIQQATNIANQVKGILGFHSPPATGPLSDSHQYMPNMMKMYASGISNNTGLLQSAAGQAAGALKAGFTTPSLAAIQSANGPVGSGSGTSGTMTFNVNMDSKCVAQVVVDKVTGQLTMNGMNRNLR